MRRWQSGQLQWTVNPSPYGLRGFKSLPAHRFGSNTLVLYSQYLLLSHFCMIQSRHPIMSPTSMKPAHSSGFTLIELLVVVSIISMLASILLVAFSTARDKARISTGISFNSSIYQNLGAQAIGIYNFNNSGNVGADSSINNLNAVWQGTAQPLVTGVNGGQAVSFNYSGQLYVSNLPDLSKASGGFTVSFFVYPYSLSGDPVGGGCPHWVYSPAYFGIACGEIWVNASNNSRVYNNFTMPSFILNDWNHVVLSYNSTNGNMYYYQDDKFIGSTYVGSLPSGTSQLYIGGAGSPWDVSGIIDDVSVYAGSI